MLLYTDEVSDNLESHCSTVASTTPALTAAVELAQMQAALRSIHCFTFVNFLVFCYMVHQTKYTAYAAAADH
jgi:hypothetical protein